MIRSGTPDDAPHLLALWLASVRATHDFLTEADIAGLTPLVEQHLGQAELWVFDAGNGAGGFVTLDGAHVDALFVAPEHFGRGVGRALLDHATGLKGPLSVDVNEQNPGALAFYRRCGFEVYGRSPVDGLGLAFPLLHLRAAASPP